MKIIGIDPGVSGGIAWIDDDRASAAKMPATPVDLVDLLRGLKVAGFDVVYMEKVQPGGLNRSKGGEGRQMGAKSAFTFGNAVGVVVGVLAALGFRVELVTPQEWQRAMSCLTGGDKNVSKAAAQRIFPGFEGKITHANADALLIAEHGRRVHR